MKVYFTKAQVYLMNYIRMLWEQHGVWTRSTITSLVFSLPNLDSVMDRLLRNPVDFEHVLQYYYGKRISSKFRDLLTEHLVVAADLVKAAKSEMIRLPQKRKEFGMPMLMQLLFSWEILILTGLTSNGE